MTSLYIEPQDSSIPDHLIAGLKRPFTDDELSAIYTEVRLTTAEKNQKEPVALWVLGPSAVGKSTITSAKAGELLGREDSAVLIDGAVLRQFHQGWQAVRNDGLSRPTPGIHKKGWDTFKEAKHAEKLKKDILLKARANRQHLIIPDCATNLEKTRETMRSLRNEGYRQHLVALWAPSHVTRERGEPRSLKEGKAFSLRGYKASVTNCLILAKEAKERNEVVDLYNNTTFPSETITLSEFEVCVDGSPEQRERALKYRTQFRAAARAASLQCSLRLAVGRSMSASSMRLNTEKMNALTDQIKALEKQKNEITTRRNAEAALYFATGAAAGGVAGYALARLAQRE